MVVLCFSSGKCVVTGGKTVDDVNIGWSLLWKDIKRFVVDPQGRAVLDGGHIIEPVMPGLACGGVAGSAGTASKGKRK